jgi:hypothetical protein
MCEQCIRIDERIHRYRQVVRSILDPITVDRAKAMIADLETQKAALHSLGPD